MSEEVVNLRGSRSVAFRELPPVPKGCDNTDNTDNNDGDFGSILLCYQYKEPPWTKKEHKQTLKKCMELGQKHRITGRGRVAPEGINFTLSGMPQDLRDFCQALRDWNPLFLETDFKLTDFIPKNKLFKSLSIRKTQELVAYGLAGTDRAPSLSKFAGTHLEATDYHEAMKDQDTVIVDVRNAYESAIGSFQPPQGGAQLLDPKMRNSIEFPKWLNDPKTQEQLHNKKVLMYCTGGIRCERATALLNQMSTTNPNLQPKGVYHMRGGIERYVKTFPQGGFWKGKNYLFDRRQEQIPGTKDQDQVEDEITSKCCLCRQKWTQYRGKFKCSQSLCGVPVIVCPSCDSKALQRPETLTCELCKEGYRTPNALPDLVGLKRKAESLVLKSSSQANSSSSSSKKKPKPDSTSNEVQEEQESKKTHPDRLFISKLPLTISKTKLQEILSSDNNDSSNPLKVVHWLKDKSTGAFYGSCIVQVQSKEIADKILQRAKEGGIKLPNQKKKLKISKVFQTQDKNNNNNHKQKDVWPPADYQEREFPPV